MKIFGIEAYLKPHYPMLKIANWHDNESTLCLSFGLGAFYIRIPKIGRGTFDGDSFGFYLQKDALVLQWGRITKFINAFWQWKHLENRERIEFVGYRETDKYMAWATIPEFAPWGNVATKHTYPYRYVLANGTIQDRTATVYVYSMEFRWRSMMWFPWIRKYIERINVEFNDEVGERTGSWKGGTIGCSYDIRPNETPEQALRRMEAERKFS